MALDAKSNWEVEMQQPTTRTAILPLMSPPGSSLPIPADHVYNATETPLPIEIILQILSYVPRRRDSQKTFWACCLISRPWYAAAIRQLYERPYLGGSNFQLFVATVCPSKNAHIRRSQLAELVKKLDMGELVHDGSKSLTARLLGRLKGTLTDFVAPQASFSIHSFAALSKCAHLTYLDLSLMSASISIKSLFQTLQSLTRLETLFFPRTSSNDRERGETAHEWPPQLKALHLAGGIDDLFLRVHVCNVPPSLDRLSIQHCPLVYTNALQETLATIGPQLRHLTIRHPMNRLPVGALDSILTWCPNLYALRLSADYITDLLCHPDNVPKGHPLRILEFDCSSLVGAEAELTPDAIWIAIDAGNLPYLRSIRVHARLAWTATEQLRTEVMELTELMEEQENQIYTGIRPGVWVTIS